MRHSLYPTVLHIFCLLCLCSTLLFHACSPVIDPPTTTSLNEQDVLSALREDDNLGDEDLPPLADITSSKERASSVQSFSLEAARNRATELFAGSVIAFGADTERGVAVWEVYVRNSSGAVVEFSFAQSTGELVEAEGYSGPFDYTLQPTSGVIDLRRALTAATTLQSGVVVQWEYERNRQGAWEYEVFVSTANGIALIEVDATTAAARLEGFRPTSAAALQNRSGGGGPPVVAPAPATVRSTVTSILSGITFRSELRREGRRELYWRVFVAASNGGVVTFRVADASGAVLKIEGEYPPFTYDFTPHSGLLLFSRARELASTALARSISNATLHQWSVHLKQEGSRRGQWIYEFEFLAAGVRWDVELDAANGTVIEIQRARF